MIKKSFLLLLAGLLSLSTFAQSIERQVIGATGTTLADGVTSIEFTVGEVTTTTVSDGTTTLTQGFNQPDLVLAIKINPVVFLQGAALNPNSGEETLMRDDLRLANYIPTTSPYSDGLIADASVFTTVGTNAIVDWVWVELRDANDSDLVLDAQSALLQRDGDVVDVDGVSTLSVSLPTGDYYVSVSHRNHLDVISATTYSLSSISTLVDLSSSPIEVEGGNNAVVSLSNGKFGMYAGDYDIDNQIQNVDATSVVQLIGGTSYNPADMDVNTQVQNSDVNALINPNIGRGQQFNRTNDGSQRLTPTIILSFNNAQITSSGSDNYYEADILIASDEDFYLGSGQIYFDYSTDAFGENVSSNNTIEYSQPVGSILGHSFGAFSPAYRDFVRNDNMTSRVSLSFQQNIALEGLETAPEIQVTATPKLLFHFKIKYIDVRKEAGICFYNEGVFQDQFFTACGGIGIADCTNVPGVQILNDVYDCSAAGVGTLHVNLLAYDSIILYPNPVSTSFEIIGITNPYDLKIYDISGKLVIQLDSVLNQSIDISSYEYGVYLVEIITEEGSVVKRLIKK